MKPAHNQPKQSLTFYSCFLAACVSLLISFTTLVYVNIPTKAVAKAMPGTVSQSLKPKAKSLSSQQTLIQNNFVTILGLHDIVDLNNPNEIPPNRRSFDIDYSKKKMEELLEYLIKNDYWILSSGQFFEYFVLGSKKIPAENFNRKAVLLTFDDGYIGVYNNLLPLLEKLNKKYGRKISVTVFINPSLMKVVHRDLHYMSCDNILAGFDAGYFDVQSHALTHRNLTQITPSELSFELSQSKRLLGQCLKDNRSGQGHPLPRFVAYPFGAVNAKVEKTARRLYSAGFAYDNKPYYIKRRENNSFRISRLIVSRDQKLEDIFRPK